MEKIKKPIQKDVVKMIKLFTKLQSENKIVKEISEIKKTSDYHFQVFFTDGTDYTIMNYFKNGIERDRRLFLAYQQTMEKKKND